MAHDNFEDLLKRQLEARRLEPSENAWERINARPRGKRSRRRGFVYTAVAAGLLLLMGWFWTNRPETVIENRVVTAPAVEPEKQVVNTAPVIAPPRLVKDKKEGWATTIVPPAPPMDKNPHVVSETPSAPVVVPTVEEQKIQEIVAELDQRQQNGKAITDATVDSLLANAQREIALEKQQRSGTDPTRLLAESEIELNRSFKERVFTAINKFRKVRIAVSSNNP